MGPTSLAIPETDRGTRSTEDGKIAVLNFSLIKPWADLFNAFTLGEATSFCSEMKSAKVRKHQILYKQGDCDNRLLFIYSGLLKLTYYNYEIKKNALLARLREGDLCGADTFFTFSPHTSTLSAIEDSRIIYIDKQSYQKIKADFPGIEPKLIDFCEKKRKSMLVLNTQGIERRAHNRYNISLQGKLRLMDSRGNVSPGSLQVDVVDISMGGACLMAREMGIGDVAVYNQSRVQLNISYQKHSTCYDITKFAAVISARILPSNECSLHLRFETPMDEAKVFEIASETNILTFL